MTAVLLSDRRIDFFLDSLEAVFLLVDPEDAVAEDSVGLHAPDDSERSQNGVQLS